MSALWWCEEHQSPTGDRHIDGVSRCFLALDEGLVVRDCRFVQQVRLVLDGIDVDELRQHVGGDFDHTSCLVILDAARAVLAALDQEDTP